MVEISSTPDIAVIGASAAGLGELNGIDRPSGPFLALAAEINHR